MDDYKWIRTEVETVQFMNNNLVTVMCMVWKEGEHSYGYVVRDVLNADSPIQVSRTRIEGHARTLLDAKRDAMDSAVDLSLRFKKLDVGVIHATHRDT